MVRVRGALSRFRQINKMILFTAVIAVILIYLTGFPVLFLIYGAFVDSFGSLDFTLKNIIKAFGHLDVLPLFGRTVLFAFGSSLFALLLGGTAAWFVERTNTRLNALVTIITLIALVIPGMFGAIAWILLLSPKAGLINVWLMGLLHLSKGPLNVYSMLGMIWVQGVHDAPFAYLLMLPILRSMDRSLEEAARMSGASMWRILSRITIPLSTPAILSILILRFIRGIEAFEIPAIIGTPKGIMVLSTKIYTIVTLEASYGAANAYGLGLIGLALVSIYLYQKMLRRSYRFATVTGKGFSASRIKLKGLWQILAPAFLTFYIIVVTILPMGIVIWNAFLPYIMQPSHEALSRLTLDNFRLLMNSEKVLLAFQNSFILASMGSFGCILLAVLTSWLVIRIRVRGCWLLDLLTFLPLTVPGIIMGVALMSIYLTLPIPIYGTLWILWIGYITIFLPLGMRFMSPALAQINVELEESAQVSGASRWLILCRIIVPLVLPAATGAGLYIFLMIFRVMSMAIVLYTPETIVVPVLVFTSWGVGSGNEVQALLLINTAVLVPLALLYHWLNKKYSLRGGRG